MKNNKVILHVGIHKTGSSTIQDSLKLDSNIITLANKGVKVLDCLPANHSEFFQSSFSESPELYHSNVNKGLDIDQINDIAAKKQVDIKRELNYVNNSTIIFTAEDACVFSVESFFKLKAFILDVAGSDASIKVVAFSRDPIDYVESAIQQNVKGNRMTIVNACQLHVQKTLDRYKVLWNKCSNVFSEDNVKIISFESAIKNNNSFLATFLHEIGVEATGTVEVRSNESICSELVCLLSILNKEECFLRQVDIDKLKVIPGEKKIILTKNTIDRIIDLATGDRDFLKNKFDINLFKKECVFKERDENKSVFSPMFVESVTQIIADFEPINKTAIEAVIHSNLANNVEV
jgi:hypothetical protein